MTVKRAAVISTLAGVGVLVSTAIGTAVGGASAEAKVAEGRYNFCVRPSTEARSSSGATSTGSSAIN